MPTDLENLIAARAALIAEIAAGPIKPSYSVGGQSVSWAEYRKGLLDQVKDLNDLIQVEGSPVEVITQGIPGGTRR